MKKNINVKIFDIIDLIPTSFFIYLFCILVLSFGALFWYLSACGSGIVATYSPLGTKEDISLLDAVYFSAITVSSLGYGDYRPIGLGRLIAAIEVLSGLSLMSIIIAKLASERQSILVRLIYASDTERRVKAFTEDVTKYYDSIGSWVNNYTERHVKIVALRSVKRLLGGIGNYLTFHAQEGVLLRVSSESYMRKLFRQMYKLQERMLLHSRGLNTPEDIRTRLIACSKQISDIAGYYKEWSSDVGIKAQCEEIVRRSLWKQNLVQQLEINNALFEAILKVLPNLPPRPGDHAVVAEKLEISKSLAAKALVKLRESGRFDER